MPKIKGGYILKPRCIKESAIQAAPPAIREMFDWLVMECNHKEKKVDSTIIKRGQCIRRYKDIQEGLHWKVGWRKMQYSKNTCETAMRWLKNNTMIHTKKTTRGILITILNYEHYQNPKNYETYHETSTRHTRNIQTPATINNNDNNVNNERHKHISIVNDFFDYYNCKLKSVGWVKRTLVLTHSRKRLIESRLREGKTLDDLKLCADNFIKDPWENRHKFIDLKYCIGIVRGIDMCEKWLNFEEKKENKSPLYEA